MFLYGPSPPLVWALTIAMRPLESSPTLLLVEVHSNLTRTS